MPQTVRGRRLIWPECLTYERLLVDRYVLSAQQYRPRKLPDGRRLEVRVDGPGPAGHVGLLGTAIIYYPDRDWFYISSFCGQGHADGPLGPFAGDPTEVLDAERAGPFAELAK